MTRRVLQAKTNWAWTLRGCLCLVAVLIAAGPCRAQGARWGVSASITPAWEITEGARRFYSAELVDLSGREMQFGVARGRPGRGDWTLAFFQRQLAKDGLLVTGSHAYTLGANVHLSGVMAEAYPTIARIRHRVSIGLLIGGGVALARGELQRDDGVSVSADDVLIPFGRDIKVHAFVELGLAAAADVGAGFRVRVSGGIAAPGRSRTTITLIYFFGS